MSIACTSDLVLEEPVWLRAFRIYIRESLHNQGKWQNASICSGGSQSAEINCWGYEIIYYL